MNPLLDTTDIIRRVRTALDEGSMLAVGVTDEPTKVGPLSGPGVIYVNPPELSFPHYGDDVDTTWTFDVIQGTTLNLDDARSFIGDVIGALHAGGLALDQARPASWRTAQGAEIPAYTLTLNPL